MPQYKEIKQGAEFLEKGVEQMNSVLEIIVENVQQEELQLAPQGAQNQQQEQQSQQRQQNQQERQ